MGERLGSGMDEVAFSDHIETGPEKKEQPLIDDEDRNDKPEQMPESNEIIEPEE